MIKIYWNVESKGKKIVAAKLELLLCDDSDGLFGLFWVEIKLIKILIQFCQIYLIWVNFGEII